MFIQHKPVKEQVIVITGASSGIGLTTAELAATEGAKLVLCARSLDTLQEIATRLSGTGSCQAIAVEADVARCADMDRVASEASAKFGRIDTWVNDAGVSTYGRIDEVTEADSRRLFDTNFWGVVNGSLAALPYLKTSRAHSSTWAAKCPTP